MRMLQGDDVTLGVWTMAELGIGTVSACLPTMRPVFLKAFTTFGGSSSNNSEQQVAEAPNHSDQSLNFDLQQHPSNPALSKAFRHIGVLGDLETDEKDHPESRMPDLVFLEDR